MSNKYNDFELIKNLFQDYIQIRATKYCTFQVLNFCSTKKEQCFLMDLSEIVKERKPHYTYKHIYIAIIYIYYGLILNEPTEDYLNHSIIKELTSNYVNVNKLIYEIVSSDEEYAIFIRRFFFQI